MQKTNLVIPSYNFAENKLPTMVYDTFGWILVALINRITLNSQRPSILCFDGIVMQSNVMLIFWMSPVLIITTIRFQIPGNQNFKTVDGLLEVGPFKNLLLQNPLNFSPWMVKNLVIKYH